MEEEISRYRPTKNYLEQNWSNFETEILKAEFVRMKREVKSNRNYNIFQRILTYLTRMLLKKVRPRKIGFKLYKLRSMPDPRNIRTRDVFKPSISEYTDVFIEQASCSYVNKRGTKS